MTFFVFLPSILLSGFMFPFAGMPKVVQWLAEVLPLTHFLRLIRGVMLRGASLVELWPEVLALLAFTAVMMTAGDPAVPQAAGLTCTTRRDSLRKVARLRSPGEGEMRKLGLVVSALLLALAGSATAAEVTVLSAARIHTMDTAQPRVQALAFDDSGRHPRARRYRRAAQALSEGQAHRCRRRHRRSRPDRRARARLRPGHDDAQRRPGRLAQQGRSDQAPARVRDASCRPAPG